MRYQDENQNDIALAPDTQRCVEGGVMTVVANDSNVPSGYTRTSDASVPITFDAQGVPSQTTVTFTYKAPAPPAAPVTAVGTATFEQRTAPSYRPTSGGDMLVPVLELLGITADTDANVNGHTVRVAVASADSVTVTVDGNPILVAVAYQSEAYVTPENLAPALGMYPQFSGNDVAFAQP